MSLLPKILSFFDLQQWNYNLPKNESCSATLVISTQNGKFQCILDVIEAENKFIFLSAFPVNVPSKLFSTISEFLIRLNFTLFFGSFEMDYESGEIRFKTSILFDNSELHEFIINQIINGNVNTMDENFILINSFITEKISLNEAIEKINNRLK